VPAAQLVPTRDRLGRSLCPKCSTVLVAGDDEDPWCPRCEWNLDAYRPDPHAGFLRKSLQRRAHVAGFRQGGQLVRELAGQEVRPPATNRDRVILLAASVILTIVTVVMVVGGAWLMTLQHPGYFLLGLFGVVVGLGLRPVLGRRRKVLEYAIPATRERAPTFFGLLDRIADEVGAPMPQTVAFDASWNALVAQTGLGRHRTMVVGLPLFVTARPQERVWLLAHELGHLVNKDMRRSLLTQPALRTFGRLAEMAWFRLPTRDNGLGLYSMIYVLFVLAMRLVSAVLFAVHLGFAVLGSREARRSEHYADALAARVAGTKAAQSALDLLVFGDDLHQIVTGATIRGGQTAEWRSTVEGARERWAERLPVRRQLTLRQEASAFAGHPATGLRHRLLGETPFQSATVGLAEADWERIDKELAPYVKNVGLWVRENFGED
jgi:Zn-dependent protease with chaperone function